MSESAIQQYEYKTVNRPIPGGPEAAINRLSKRGWRYVEKFDDPTPCLLFERPVETECGSGA